MLEIAAIAGYGLHGSVCRHQKARMKISEDRFKAILDGTATDLSSKEIILRAEVFFAEAQGRDPLEAIEKALPDVTIVRKDRYRQTSDTEVTQVSPTPTSTTFPESGGVPRLDGNRMLPKTMEDWLVIWFVVISVSVFVAPAIASSMLGVAGIALLVVTALTILQIVLRIFGWPSKTKTVSKEPEAPVIVPRVNVVDHPIRAALTSKAPEQLSRPRQVGQQMSLHSPQLVSFSERHCIPLDKFFNAAGLKTSDYTHQMRSAGAIIAYNVPPYSRGGHTIRNRYGKCVVCDPKQIGFNQRAFEAGFVYAAFSPSKGLVKIGFTKDVRRRQSTLIRERYAGAGDWEVYYQMEAEDGGRREIDAHKALAQYAVKGLTYRRDGRMQEAGEAYRCSKENAIRALEGR